MGIEYYLIKPEIKEIFYLGKHINCPDGIANAQYSKEATRINYSAFKRFFWDFVTKNEDVFYGTTLSYDEVKVIVQAIYDWCGEDKVIFDHDCSNNAKEWLKWKETGSLITLFETYNDSHYRNIQNFNIPEELMKAALILCDQDEDRALALLRVLQPSQWTEVASLFEGLKMNLDWEEDE